MATREGGSEWEPIKILSKENSAYVPKSHPSILHTCCQDHVAITVLLTLGTTQQPKYSKHAAENNLSTRNPQGVQTGLQGRLDHLGSDQPYTTRWITCPQHVGSPIQKQRHSGSPVQLTPSHPSKHSDAKPGPGQFDRLSWAVRPPPPEELQTTRIDPLQRQITTRINFWPLGRFDRGPGAIRPPPPEELQTTRIDPIQRHITTKINLWPLGQLDRGPGAVSPPYP